jgi:phospholipid/cholesterol/gamma-HCH transport system substrate-binding protein
MTATVEMDLTQTLCRYVIDPATGALKALRPEDIPTGTCGQAGTPPGNQRTSAGGGFGGGTSPLSTLPGDIVGQVPDPKSATGIIGAPAIAGVTQ